MQALLLLALHCAGRCLQGQRPAQERQLQAPLWRACAQQQSLLLLLHQERLAMGATHSR